MAQRNQQFSRITQLIAARPLRAEAVGEAARDVAALLRANPRDVDAATARQRLFAALAEGVANAGSTAELTALAQALAPAREAFAGDANLARIVTDLEAARGRVAADEQARLAASMGELVIDAAPWANVQSVVDAARKPVALPADASTPLRLSVPAGVVLQCGQQPGVPAPCRLLGDPPRAPCWCWPR
jgi:hypothetical protein